MVLTNPLHCILDANRLTGLNYTDWLRNLRIVLTTEKITYVLDTIVPTPEEGASEDEIARYSILDSFSHFIMNFNMSKFEVTLPELLNILREAESAFKKEKPALYIGETKKKKASKTLKKDKGKERLGKTNVAKKYPGKDKG
ncbi:hypothetical protein B296_00048541 [Ensete ventricosum]|uniref:Uncharacterized protein n=1 Tax=Ensete ventricosum TaxID=4639 RepID=A0A426X7Y8_ENSVE|nr:hypothetical protein B296_00048541 [Ensete ventricosum]